MDSALALLLETGRPFDYADVRDLAEPGSPGAPALTLDGQADLKVYDRLFAADLNQSQGEMCRDSGWICEVTGFASLRNCERLVMGVREIDRFLKQWEMNVRDAHRRTILAPTPRERERWQAIWLLAQGWTASATPEALERDPHTIGRWATAFGEGGAEALIFEQTGGSPPWRGAAGGVERGGTTAAVIIGHRNGQLVLESGSAVRLGTVRRQFEPQQLPELPAPDTCTGWDSPSSGPRSAWSRRMSRSERPSLWSTPPCGTRRSAPAQRSSSPTRPTSGLTRNCGGSGY